MTDSEILNWLESWQNVHGKPDGYGDIGIDCIITGSDGFYVDSEFGGGCYDCLRDAVISANKYNKRESQNGS